MLGNHEIDTLCMDDTRLTLAHTAAMTNNLSVLALLVNEGGLPLHALQLPDENLVSPAMVAIQVRLKFSVFTNWKRIHVW